MGGVSSSFSFLRAKMQPDKSLYGQATSALRHTGVWLPMAHAHRFALRRGLCLGQEGDGEARLSFSRASCRQGSFPSSDFLNHAALAAAAVHKGECRLQGGGAPAA